MPEYTISQKALYQKIYSDLLKCMGDQPQNFRQELKEALLQGYPINFCEEHGQCILLNSVWHDRAVKAGIPEILLGCGADPNIGTKNNFRPLDQAIYMRRPLELVKRLIDAGADVDAQDKCGKTAFSCAAGQYINADDESTMKYGLDTVRLLLEHNADPYLCDKWLESKDRETEEVRARRMALVKLCEAYFTMRGGARRQTDHDSQAFMR